MPKANSGGGGKGGKPKKTTIKDVIRKPKKGFKPDF